MSMKHWWDDTDRENRSTSRKTSSSTTLSMTNPAWDGLDQTWASMKTDQHHPPESWHDPVCFTNKFSDGTGNKADSPWVKTALIKRTLRWCFYICEFCKIYVFMCRRLCVKRNLRNLAFLCATMWKLLVNAWNSQYVEVVTLWWTLLTNLPVSPRMYVLYLLTFKRFSIR